ncbi:sensor histidine kinase [Luteibacter pinisoli]|nr:sensor histidine kinase [Luteibacter pinisoli]
MSRILQGMRSLACAAGMLLAVATHAQGVPPSLVHTSWPVSRGAPADVWAMVQGRDGYLWLGTGSGLVRFDGTQFEPARLADGSPMPAGNITSLLAGPDGSMWMGFYRGGLARLKDGVYTRYPFDHTLSSGWVSAMAATPDGVIWAATSGGLLRFANGRWSRVGSDWGLVPGNTGSVLVDPEGTLWVAGAGWLVFLPPGANAFRQTNVPVREDSTLGRAPDGTLWLSDKLGGTRALPGVSAAHPVGSAVLPPESMEVIASDRMMFDREGRLWSTDTVHRSLFIIDRPGEKADGRPLKPADAVARFDSRNGMASDQMTPLLQDREGTVWVGTNFGIDSFRPASVSTFSGLDRAYKLDYLFSPGPDGHVWLAARRSVWRADGDAMVHMGDFPDDVYQVVGRSATEAWVLTEKELWHLENGKWRSRPYVPGGSLGGDLAIDAKGGLWAVFYRLGAYHLDGETWEKLPVESGAGHDPWGVFPANNGAVWFAGLDGLVMQLPTPDSTPRVWHVPALGAVWSMDVKGPLVLASGESGIALLQAGRFIALNAFGTMPLLGVTGIAQRDGQVWLNTSRGVIAITTSELERAFLHKGPPPRYQLFDYRDGLPGIALQAARNTLGFDERGRLVVASNQGPAFIDPGKAHHNPIPPDVFIRLLDTDQGAFAPSAFLRLPSGTSRLHVTFTATSLAVPERVAFRYRLTGVDAGWQDSGTRREAFYTNLSPGDYRFEVMAANEDGVWSSGAAAAAFSIPPLFHQTLWFRAGCIVLGVLLIGLAIVWRTRQYGRRIRLQADTRHAERERIARELHDTLLQSVQGLTLRFATAAEALPADDPARASLDDALTVAETVIGEGRDRLLELRSTDDTGRSLGEALALAGREAETFFGTPFVFEEQGKVVPVVPAVAAEIVDIMREALFNAYRHANATLIVCHLRFEPGELAVSVADNGHGIVAGDTQSTASHRHFGITGMRERATRIQAHLDIRPRAFGGTEVRLRISARHAYARWSGPWARHGITPDEKGAP